MTAQSRHETTDDRLLTFALNSEWTCWGCARTTANGHILDRCPSCGGVWVRPVRLTRWQRLRDRLLGRWYWR